jgi:branched-chain amino acid transport system permease protein
VWFFAALVIDGALAGIIYALAALAFVLVYKASRMINFALGEWMMFGALLTAAGGMIFAAAGMVALAALFNRLVLRHLTARPVISSIMVTLGLGAMMRGTASFLVAATPKPIGLPIPGRALDLAGNRIPADKLTAAAVAALCIAGLAWFYRRSRTGLALRAIADDPQAAMSAGIDLDRHRLIVWGLTGTIALVAGILWTLATGGGFGVALVGLKVFPIVIVGGLDSIPGAIAGALAIGILESLGAGYLDPALGGGFGNIASYLALLAMLAVRPQGLFGQPQIERV